MELKADVWGVTKSVCLVVFVVFVGYFGYRGINALEKITDKPHAEQPASLSEAEIERIAKDVVRRDIVESNKELKKIIKDLKEQNSKLIAIIEERDSKIEEVGIIVAGLKQQIDKMNAPSDHSYAKGKKEDHEFIKVHRKDTEGKKYPVAWAMYHPNKEPEKAWKTGTYPVEFKVTVIETEQKSGVFDKYVEAWVENNQFEETKGKRYPVEIVDTQWVRREVKDKGFSFNPRLGVSGMAGTEAIMPGLDISLFSYGRTNRDIDWRFITVGVGGTKDDLYGYVFPVQYNLGNVLPLVENLNIGPFVGINQNSQTNIGAGISVLF